LLVVAAVGVAALGVAVGAAWSQFEHRGSEPIARAILADQDLTSLQRTILEDGVVTPEEYSQAREATFSCLESKGLEPQRDRAGIYAGVPDPTVGNSEEVGKALKECMAAGVEPIDRVWSAQGVPEDREAAARLVLGACLRAAGFEVPARPTEADIREIVNSGLQADESDALVEFARCNEKAELARLE
jgi:hypothetical protein